MFRISSIGFESSAMISGPRIPNEEWPSCAIDDGESRSGATNDQILGSAMTALIRVGLTFWWFVGWAKERSEGDDAVQWMMGW